MDWKKYLEEFMRLGLADQAKRAIGDIEATVNLYEEKLGLPLKFCQK